MHDWYLRCDVIKVCSLNIPLRANSSFPREELIGSVMFLDPVLDRNGDSVEDFVDAAPDNS